MMGHRTDETFHRSEEAARAAQRNAVANRLPDEDVYARGVFPCRFTDDETGELIDGFKSITETYYG